MPAEVFFWHGFQHRYEVVRVACYSIYKLACAKSRAIPLLAGYSEKE